MSDYVDTLNDVQFLARYLHYGEDDDRPPNDDPRNDAPPLNDAYGKDEAPASRWRQFYDADAYEAQLRADRT